MGDPSKNYVIIAQTTIPGERYLSYEIEMPGDELAFSSIYAPRVWDGREKFDLCFKAGFIDPSQIPAPFDIVRPSRTGWYNCSSKFRPEIIVEEDAMEEFTARYNQKHALNKSDAWVFEPFNVKIGVSVYSYSFRDNAGNGLGLRYIKVGLLNRWDLTGE
jgi:hypothetical protein